MSDDLIILTPGEPPETVDSGRAGAGEGALVSGVTGSADALAALAAAIDFASQALAPATLRAYRAAWQHFCGWCQDAEWSPLPAAPETVGAYLASLATTHTTSTLVQRLAALSRAHRLANLPWPSAHPSIRNTLRGIQRKYGKPAKQAAALATDELRKLVATCDTTPTGQRDRALLLLGYAGALRRSELVAVTHEHLQFTNEGIRLMIPRAKGDQAGRGVSIGIPKGKAVETCPTKALEAWVRTSAIGYGPVFRGIDARGVISNRGLHPDAVRKILAKRAAQAGIKVPSGERLSPHGLRTGFITQAYVNGARDEQIMDHTRQKDIRTMRGYVRRAKLVSDSPAHLLGL